MKKVKIYIAGAYGGDNISNIRTAVRVADSILHYFKGRVTVYVPHLTGFWDLVVHHDVYFWYAFDLDWLEVCDIVYRIPGESLGSDKEVEYAKAIGKVVFFPDAVMPTLDSGIFQALSEVIDAIK